MSEASDLGKAGEKLAVEYLEKAGYKILTRNFKWGKIEIDIIAENRDFIVFAEVKTRSDDFYVHPRDAVTREKQRSIIYAASGYLERFKINKESRFDVITIINKNNGHEIDHIEDAFYPTLR